MSLNVSNYVKHCRDDGGVVRYTQSADGEFRDLHRQIELLKNALEIEAQSVADLRELVNQLRRTALELNEQLAKGNN